MNIEQVFVLAVYGVTVSWIQERFGKFQDLDSRTKQLVNGILTVIIPLIVVYLQPYWRPEYGNINETVNSFVLLIVPAIIWLASQLGHYLDQYLNSKVK